MGTDGPLGSTGIVGAPQSESPKNCKTSLVHGAHSVRGRLALNIGIVWTACARTDRWLRSAPYIYPGRTGIATGFAEQQPAQIVEAGGAHAIFASGTTAILTRILAAETLLFPGAGATRTNTGRFAWRLPNSGPRAHAVSSLAFNPHSRHLGYPQEEKAQGDR